MSRLTDDEEEPERFQFTLQHLAALLFFISAILMLAKDSNTIYKTSAEQRWIKYDVQKLQEEVKALKSRLEKQEQPHAD